MLRYENLKDISDGRIYSASDTACLDTNGCKGCSKCCESDMGKSIVLDPYDIYHMTAFTGKTFDNLLTEFLIELSMIDGIVLPNMKMDKGCGFLDDNKRCSIHPARPSICRLFPLGRLYLDKGFGFILQTNECKVEDRGEAVISDWIGIPEQQEHDAFIMKWHRFLSFERKRVNEIREYAANEAARLKDIPDEEVAVYAGIVGDSGRIDEEGVTEYRKRKSEEFILEADDRIKEVMKAVLKTFYLDEYDRSVDFYSQFEERMKRCISVVRKL